MELEMVSRKVDRFGWDRMDGMFKDRLVADWVAALEKYPIKEIRAGIAAAIVARPNHCPNEGHVVGEIANARSSLVKSLPKPEPKPEPDRGPRVTEEAAEAIMREAGFGVRKFGGKS